MARKCHVNIFFIFEKKSSVHGTNIFFITQFIFCNEKLFISCDKFFCHEKTFCHFTIFSRDKTFRHDTLFLVTKLFFMRNCFLVTKLLVMTQFFLVTKRFLLSPKTSDNFQLVTNLSGFFQKYFRKNELCKNGCIWKVYVQKIMRS